MNVSDFDFVLTLARTADWPQLVPQAIGLATMGAGAIVGLWKGGSAAVVVSRRVGGWLLARLRPEPSELCQAVLEAMSGPYLEASKQHTQGILVYPRVTVDFGSLVRDLAADVTIQQESIRKHVNELDFRRIMAKAHKDLDAIVAAREQAQNEDDELTRQMLLEQIVVRTKTP